MSFVVVVLALYLLADFGGGVSWLVLVFNFVVQFCGSILVCQFCGSILWFNFDVSNERCSFWC